MSTCCKLTIDETKILLCNNTTSRAEKYQAANNIITTYELNLEPEQILTAFIHVRVFNNARHRFPCLKAHTFMLGMLPSVNKNMYIAVILALNNNFYVSNLGRFVHYPDGDRISCFGLVGVAYYCRLLNYYDFDVSSMDIDETYKQKIQEYRDNKYGGNMTKPAIRIAIRIAIL